jgi:uncharacterized protein YkwD
MTYVRRALTALLVSVLVIGAGTVMTPSTAAARAAWEGTSTAATSEYADRLLKRVNSVRAERGVRKLRLQACTDGFAEEWAETMVRRDLWGHSDLGELMSRCDATYASENLATWTMGMSPARVVKSWMRSSGHRRNLLAKKARRVGVAVRYDDNRQRFYAVMDFTRPA